MRFTSNDRDESSGPRRLFGPPAAPPPVDNGMLATIRARLDEFVERIDLHDARLDDLCKLIAKVRREAKGHG